MGKVESELKTCPLVDNICVYGESTKDHCVALVVPNQQQLAELATKKGIKDKSFEQLCTDPELEKAVVQEIAVHGKKSKCTLLFENNFSNLFLFQNVRDASILVSRC